VRPRTGAQAHAGSRNAPELFVSEVGSDAINIYTDIWNRRGATYAASITAGVSGAVGIWIDRKGTLYVANETAGNVTEYARGSTTPDLTISQGLMRPLTVAVDSHGTLYVGDWYGYIAEYPPGKTAPSAQVTGLQTPAQMAFDAADNLYVADSGGGGFGAVWEVPFGQTSKQGLNLQGIENPMGIAFDLFGDLVVSDGGLMTNEIFVYPPGQIHPACTVTQGLTGGPSPANIAIGTSGALYVAQQNEIGSVVWSVLAYSVSGFALRSTSASQMDRPFGVAVWEPR
jgi:hypothetical protein